MLKSERATSVPRLSSLSRVAKSKTQDFRLFAWRQEHANRTILCPFCQKGEGVPPFVCPVCHVAFGGSLKRGYAALWGEASLIHPENLKLVKLARHARPEKLETSTSLKCEWSKATLERLGRWLKTAAPQNLAHLLRANPRGLFHPVVYRQIQHLDQSRYVEIEGETTSIEKDKTRKIYVQPTNIFIVRNSKHPSDISVPEPVMKAEAELARLIQAWAQGLLPHHRITIDRPRRRGCPTKADIADKLKLAVRFQKLRTLADHEPRAFFRQQPNEADQDFIARLAAWLQKLPRHEEPLFALYGSQIILFDSKNEREPLSIKTAEQIAGRAIARKRKLKDSLLLCYLAHDEDKRPGQMEGLINRAKKLWSFRATQHKVLANKQRVSIRPRRHNSSNFCR